MRIGDTYFFSIRTILIGLLWGIGIAIVTLYGIFQARLLLFGPSITLQELPHITEDRRVNVRGVATTITKLTLNGRAIYTDEEGNFSEDSVLPMGYTTITIEGVDRYGSRTAVTRGITRIQ